jgi:NAD(P)-dependent dehydrogenase (short-subunit alcohol dehydrogenase family)
MIRLEASKRRFSGKVALVTGASSGIGRATAIAFAQEGAQVVLASRREPELAETLQLVRAAGADGIVVRTDVSKASEVEALATKIVEYYGRLDCAVNNAGVDGPKTALWEHTEKEFEQLIAVNVKGVWLCMKYEIRQMLKQSAGTIVNIASIGGVIGVRGLSVYTGSKHAVIGLTKSAALEGATAGIRVNAVCPALIEDTNAIQLLAREHPDMYERLRANHPLGRCGTTQEVAAAVLFLCSEETSFITGQALLIDGGAAAGH